MVGAAGLTFTVAMPATKGRRALAATSGQPVTINPWVTISRDGTVSIMSPAAEMGQGSRTSLPLILAEELDADWTKVRIVPAPPIDAIYGNPKYYDGAMYTSASATVWGYFSELRKFGAQVRRVLLDNAAARWKVPVDELTTEPGIVVHRKSGRRLGYGEIATFAKVPAKAPEIKDEALKPPSKFRLIGRDVMRVELPQKVDGSAKYSIDVHVPGMLYGAVLRAPVEGAAPDRVDQGAARRIPGVFEIVRLPYGVGVVATTPTAAFSAKSALAVSWTHGGRAWSFDSDRMSGDYAATARNLGTPGFAWDKVGDALAALPKSAARYEAEYRCDMAYHAQMEPLNAVASVAPAGDTAEIWCGTQAQTMAVGATARALGIAPEKVKLHDMLLGGGFGRRGHRDQEYVVDAVLLSRAVKKPVKVMWTREDDVHNGRFRPLTGHYLQAGFDQAGQLTAWHYRFATHVITPFQDPERFKATGGRDFNTLVGAEIRTYAIPNRLSEQLARDEGIRTSSLRAIGVGSHKFAIESFLDEIAAKRGLDPVKVRLALLKDTPRGQRVVEEVARMADWGRKREGTGLGFAFVDYSSCLMAGIAEVSVNRRSGEIACHNFWLALDPGLAVQPDNVIAQSESCIVYGLGLALSERITIAGGIVQQSNFYDYNVPRMADVPDIHVKLVQSDVGPYGVGQMATPVVAPAIGNAVAALTGARLRELPMTPERVLAALKV